MSTLKLVLAAAAILISLPANAEEAKRRVQPLAVSPAAFPSLTPIYLVSGLRDNQGAAHAGSASTIACTNWNASAVQIRFLVKAHTGAVVASKIQPVAAGYTFTVSTHDTAFVIEDDLLSPGSSLNQGSLIIFATSPYVTCSASMVDAAATVPHGVDLHLVRFNAWPNSQE